MPNPYVSWRKLASGRQNAEDRAEVFERGDDLVVVVADGAGGTRGGALASSVLVESARFVAENPSLDAHDIHLWTKMLTEADRTLAARHAGETTCIVVVVGASRLTGVSVGDSEAWIIRSESIDDLTCRQERHRVGSGRATAVGFQRGGVDGVLLVATDGLFRYGSAERIAATIRAGDLSRAAERLTTLVRLPSGGFQDDGIVVIASR
jgi:serine/threonine protein phosphatase PrpC